VPEAVLPLPSVAPSFSSTTRAKKASGSIPSSNQHNKARLTSRTLLAVVNFGFEEEQIQYLIPRQDLMRGNEGNRLLPYGSDHHTFSTTDLPSYSQQRLRATQSSTGLSAHRSRRTWSTTTSSQILNHRFPTKIICDSRNYLSERDLREIGGTVRGRRATMFLEPGLAKARRCFQRCVCYDSKGKPL
jgi:hypothetical protein